MAGFPAASSLFPAQYLREVAVGPGAATESLLVTQAVVEGRLHHVACIDLAGADVVFIRQAAKQVLGVAHELGVGEEKVRLGDQASECTSTLCLRCSLTLSKDRRGAWKRLRTQQGIPTAQGRAPKSPLELPWSLWLL